VSSFEIIVYQKFIENFVNYTNMVST